MMFSRFALVVAVLLALGCWSCAGKLGPEDLLCHKNSECDKGYACDGAEKCVKTEALAITTATLNDAVKNVAYTEALAATGGILPYHWSVTVTKPTDGSLDWLEIDAGSGELRCKTDGQGQLEKPSVVVPDGLIEVTVTDTSNAGSGQSVTKPFSLVVKECSGPVQCSYVQGGACYLGTRSCDGGILAADCTGGNLSTAAGFCGPGDGTTCGKCDTLVADRCSGGLLCLCGSDTCSAGQICCLAVCVDTKKPDNCGTCGNDCTKVVLNVNKVTCNAGICGYDTCVNGCYDCDGNTANGCEQQADTNHCSGCLDDCKNTNTYIHTDPQAAQCQNGVCTPVCIAGFGDCLQDKDHPGCETQLHTSDNCSDCGAACTNKNGGTVCLQDGGTWRCGCTADANCTVSTDQLCCGSPGTCVDRNVQHCSDCNTQCTLGSGGLTCVHVNSSYECQCTDASNNAECKAGFPYSDAWCDVGATNKCRCTASASCAQTIDDMCCKTGGVDKCTNMNNGDIINCGLCGAHCASPANCINGSCTCNHLGPPPQCPVGSGAPDCVNDVCVCAFYGNQACLPGQYCVLNQGCCLTSNAAAADCSIACLQASKFWCSVGCCTNGCKSDGTCS